MEYLRGGDLEKVGRLRISQACFRNAANFLDNARYALGQAIGVRKYFLDNSEAERDENHVLGDLRSRFYADYVALLLYSTAEHTRLGILEMLGLKTVTAADRSRIYALKKTLNALEAHVPDHPITTATKIFDASGARHKAWNYRNAWVHDQPKRVESILYNPPRQSFVVRDGSGFDYSLIGATTSFDYTWDELVELFQEALHATKDFLEVCGNEWEAFHDVVKAEYETRFEPDNEAE